MKKTILFLALLTLCSILPAETKVKRPKSIDTIEFEGSDIKPDASSSLSRKKTNLKKDSSKTSLRITNNGIKKNKKNKIKEANKNLY